MTQLVHPENIRRAATSLFLNEIRTDLSGEFDAQIGEAFDDAVSDYLSHHFDAELFDGEPDTAEEQINYYVSDMTGDIASSLEDMIGNGIAGDWVDGQLIYTSDIMEFYDHNMAECDDMLTEIDPSGANSISEIISMCVYYVLESQALSELSTVANDLLMGVYDEIAEEYLA